MKGIIPVRCLVATRGRVATHKTCGEVTVRLKRSKSGSKKGQIVAYTVLGKSEQDAKPSWTPSQIITYYRRNSFIWLEIITEIIFLTLFFHSILVKA